MKDLILLVADKNSQFALSGALERWKALGIHKIDFEFIVHPGRDGGARKSGAELLALERRRFNHGLLIFDLEGSGNNPDAIALESELDGKLHSRWNDSAKAIVIEPEVDVWIWGSDNAVEEVIGWPPGKTVRQWLREHGYTFEVNGKPTRPKEAFEAALRYLKQPRSSALYRQIAGKISLQKCGDQAFIRLRNQLVKWFPPLADN